jgi:hypothetical protein
MPWMKSDSSNKCALQIALRRENYARAWRRRGNLQTYVLAHVHVRTPAKCSQYADSAIMHALEILSNQTQLELVRNNIYLLYVII